MTIQYKNGQLHVDDVAVKIIAEAVGTPFYVYSETVIRQKFKEFAGTAAAALKSSLVCFAVKSNANLSVLKILASLGAGADIVSGWELLLALKAGIPADRIVFSGVGKTADELTLAIENGIKQINVESEEEALMINEIAERFGKKANIALRINPDVDAHTHYKMTTGKKENKFGIDWKKARELYQKFNALPGLNPCGIDVHVGSQLTELAPFQETFSRTREIVRALREDGITIRTIDVGGGLGIAYKDSDTPPSMEEYIAVVEENLGHLDCEIVFEPGRRLLAEAGLLITQVVRVKQTETRAFAIVDAGMNDLIRPAIYEAYHGIIPVSEAEVDTPYDVVGPICESSDVFGKDRRLPPLKAGDLLAVKAAGAYGTSMSSNYNMRPLCPEILVKGNTYAVIRERQTLEDVIARQQGAPWLV